MPSTVVQGQRDCLIDGEHHAKLFPEKKAIKHVASRWAPLALAQQDNPVASHSTYGGRVKDQSEEAQWLRTWHATANVQTKRERERERERDREGGLVSVPLCAHKL